MPKKATTSAEKETAVKPSARKASARSAEAKGETIQEQAPVSEPTPSDVHSGESRVMDLHDYVTVRNGFNGQLIYKSKRTGERLIWDEFGAEQDMELQELKNAKNSSRMFFENNWFLIDDPEIIAFLGLERYYKNALGYDDFDTLFRMNPSEIERRIKSLPSGQKANVIHHARQRIAEGKIDSLRVVNALEKALGVELINR